MRWRNGLRLTKVVLWEENKSHICIRSSLWCTQEVRRAFSESLNSCFSPCPHINFRNKKITDLEPRSANPPRESATTRPTEFQVPWLVRQALPNPDSVENKLGNRSSMPLSSQLFLEDGFGLHGDADKHVNKYFFLKSLCWRHKDSIKTPNSSLWVPSQPKRTLRIIPSSIGASWRGGSLQRERDGCRSN
jgi:hypothetical protein